jgi:hypothetical protein
MVIDTYNIYESLEGLSCYIIGGVGVPVSLRHNGLSMVRIRGSSESPHRELEKMVNLYHISIHGSKKTLFGGTNTRKKVCKGKEPS